MACNDDFVIFLSAREGKFYRDSIHVDDIEQLSALDNQNGKLKYLYTYKGDSSKSRPHPYYRCWMRQRAGYCRYISDEFGNQRFSGFSRMIEFQIRKHQKYSEIYIVAFADENMTIPRHIGPNDEIFRHLKKLSQQLCAWRDEFVDEFAEEKKPDEDSDGDDSDSDGDHDLFHR